MSQYHSITLDELHRLAFKAAQRIKPRTDRPALVYAIPRGGISAALAMRAHKFFEMTDDPIAADYIVDDLIDSGDTMARTMEMSLRQEKPEAVVLIDKRDPASEYHGKWIVFPWEGGSTTDTPETIQDNIKRLLQFIEPETYQRGGLDETPARVAKAWAHWGGGYDMDPAAILKTFEDGADGCNEMVLVRDIPVYSHCEHHLASIFGKATVAYIPDGKIVGLSKLSRLVDCFARRLQVQERLTNQIADALETHLKPKGVGVIVTARHMCMESRGVCQQGHDTVTSALRGVMLEGTPRAEFLALARK
jgi:GTP cyclohydrolase I